MNRERVERFTADVKRAQMTAERSLRSGNDDERELTILRMTLRGMRDRAVLAARFAGVTEADPSEVQIDAVLAAVAEHLKTWGDDDAAEYLTADPDARLALLRHFGHEEPPGLG